MAIKTTALAATIEDLYRIPEHGKAEVVHGEIIREMPTGGRPGRASARIVFHLMLFEQTSNLGKAIPDNTGYRVHLPHRESFSPDASFYTGTQIDMKFIEGAPEFAAEIRSENDYGAVAESEMAEKRRDYFAAGTKVVWDVDLLNEPIIRKYATDDPVTPAAVFRRGDIADAEPAVPGWTMPVEELFT
jgi:Uma2 family endonuclease